MNDGWIESTILPGLSLLLVASLPAIIAAGYTYRPWRKSLTVMAPWAAFPALVFAVVAPTGMTTELSWLLLGSQLGLDDTARVFLFFTALIWLLAGFYTLTYMEHDVNRERFFILYLITMSGNLGLILAQDMLSFFLGFATMSFASYGLVVHNPDSDTRFAARIYMILVVLGEVLLFTAMVGAAGSANSLLFQDVTHAMTQTPGRELILALFLIGFGIKVGALPMHVWMPLAYSAAPTPASAVLGGAMLNAGLLGWMRFLPLGTMAFPGWGTACIAAGLTAAFYGVLVGVTQRHPKTVLAYSSISQMGLLAIALGCGLAAPESWPIISVVMGMYALHHALAKGALFLGVGVASTDLDRAWKRGLVGCGLLLPALALAGAPFTSGAAAKVSLKAVTRLAPSTWPSLLDMILPWSAVGTTLLMGRFVILMWPRSTPQPSQIAPSLWLPWVLLLMGSAVSVFVWPWVGDVTPLRDAVSSKLASKALWPVGLGTAIALAVWGASRRITWLRNWQIPAGDVLIPVNRTIVSMGQSGGTEVVTHLRQYVYRIARQWAVQGAVKEGSTLITRGEQSLMNWIVGGTLFVLLAATLLVCFITLSA